MKTTSLRRPALPFAPAATAALIALFALAAPLAAQSPLSFDLRVAPGVDGTLDASASLSWRWASFLQSGARFSARTTVSEWTEDSGESTALRSEKVLDLDLLRVPGGVLGFEAGPFGAWLGGGLVANGVMLDEERYGHGEAAGAYVYYQDTRTLWLKPLLAADLTLALGPADLEIAYRTSWPFTLDEHVSGSGFYSTDPAPVDFTLADEGFETLLSAAGRVELGGGWTARTEGSWLRRIGHTVAIASGLATQYVYESTAIDGAFSVTVPIGERRPSFGLGWSRFAFRPLEEFFDVASYESSRIRVLVGLEL